MLFRGSHSRSLPYVGVNIFVVIFLCLPLLDLVPADSKKENLVEECRDFKDFKKILKTRKNVLVLFADSQKSGERLLGVCREVALAIKGSGSILYVNCANSDSKKLCKKIKVNPNPVELKHYKDGEFHKDYDRREDVKPMINFMRDPTGDIPWEEDSSAQDIEHVDSAQAFSKLLRKTKTGMLVMFYAPWCGFCKRMKPDYASAATQLKGHSVLAAVDCTRQENSIISQHFNITGFPTLIYFENGQVKQVYEGENTLDAIVRFMRDPSAAPTKAPGGQEPAWSEEPSEVVHLTEATFNEFVQSNPSVLVMFYAPWCGHCKKMKPQFVEAAAAMKSEGIPGVLAAVDATVEKELGKRFEVKGYPTIKYFQDGEFAFNAPDAREKKTILDFMKDPKEPPPPPPPEPVWSEVESNVLHLTDDDYRAVLKRKKHVLVMFYAPWCPHCKSAKPEVSAAAEHFKDNPKVALAAVDCTVEKATCERFKIKGYPAFKYFQYYDKAQEDYNRGRTAADFVAFLNRFVATSPTDDPEPPSVSGEPKAEEMAETGQTPVSNGAPQTQGKTAPVTPQEYWGIPGGHVVRKLTSTNWDAELRGRDAIVFFYVSWCGFCRQYKFPFASAAESYYQSGGNSLLWVAIDGERSPEIISRLKIEGYPTVAYFGNGQLVENYTGPRTRDGLLQFARSISPPVVGMSTASISSTATAKPEAKDEL